MSMDCNYSFRKLPLSPALYHNAPSTSSEMSVDRILRSRTGQKSELYQNITDLQECDSVSQDLSDTTELMDTEDDVNSVNINDLPVSSSESDSQ